MNLKWDSGFYNNLAVHEVLSFLSSSHPFSFSFYLVAFSTSLETHKEVDTERKRRENEAKNNLTWTATQEVIQPELIDQ